MILIRGMPDGYWCQYHPPNGIVGPCVKRAGSTKMVRARCAAREGPTPEGGPACERVPVSRHARGDLGVAAYAEASGFFAPTLPAVRLLWTKGKTLPPAILLQHKVHGYLGG